MTAESSTTPADPRAELAKEIRIYLDEGWEAPYDAKRLLAAAHRLLSLPDTEGVAPLRASGTPVEAIADALKDMRLNLGPHALEAIYGGANYLVLTGGERHTIALTALKALGLEES